MKYTKGLTFKPIKNRDIATALEKGALVHMLEFAVPLGTQIHNNNLLGHLRNFLGAYSDGKSGSVSAFNDRTFYDAESKTFPAMPTSAIKEGFPFILFDSRSNVGVIKNPKSVRFSYIAFDDCYSDCSFMDGHVSFTPETVRLKDAALAERMLLLNKGSDGIVSDNKQEITIPFVRKTEDEKALRDFFNNGFFDAYSGGNEPGSNKFIKSFGKAFKSGLSNLCEVGINSSTSADIAIIIYDNGLNRRSNQFDYFAHESDTKLEGVNLAFLLQQAIKQRSGKELPIMLYRHKDGFAPPEILEVQIEKAKIATNLKTIERIHKLYDKILGKEAIQEILYKKDAYMKM